MSHEQHAGDGRGGAGAGAQSSGTVSVLVVTQLFPTRDQPYLGSFLARTLQLLLPHGFHFEVALLLPWAPVPIRWLPRWRRYSPGNAPRPLNDVPIRILRYPRPPGTWYLRLEGSVMSRVLRRKAEIWHRSSKFDVVLSASMFSEADAASDVGDQLKLPVACLAIGSDVNVMSTRSPFLAARLRRLLDRIDLPICVSEDLRARLQQLAPAGARAIRCYLGRDTDLFKPPLDRLEARRALGLGEASVIGVYVGAISEAKGALDLAAALSATLPELPQMRLIAIGSGICASALLDAARRSGRPGAVTLTGSISPADVARYLQASDFLVFPSHAEGLPQAVLEAMNSGLPVVASRVGGIPEAVIDEVTGILIEPARPDQLAQAMRRMVLDPGFRARAGEAGMARAETVFNPSHQATTLAASLRELAGR